MSEEVALGQVTVADLQPGDRVRIDGVVRTVLRAQRKRWLRFTDYVDADDYEVLPLTQPVELLSADQDDDDAIREALYESTSEVER
jgi:DNA replicative helicase MCM subunit Mcm2 (Cdc46/Mcm family)